MPITNVFTFKFCCLLQWGYIVVRTPEGIVDHEEAIKLNIGGQILGYFY